jgi:hypothetical protein
MTNSNTPISASTGQPKPASPASNPQQTQGNPQQGNQQQGNQQQNQGKPQQNQGGNKPNTDKPAGQPQQK